MWYGRGVSVGLDSDGNLVRCIVASGNPIESFKGGVRVRGAGLTFGYRLKSEASNLPYGYLGVRNEAEINK